jgi:hypothetical protein
LVVLLASCSDRALTALDSRVKGLEAKGDAFEKRLAAVEVESKATTRMAYDSDLRLKTLEDKESLVSCADKGYAFVATELGQLMAACEDLKPFGDGYKLTLRVGNPHQVLLNGLSIKVRYHPKWGSTPFEIREVSTNVTDRLLPGTWSRITLVLSPARAEDTGMIWVTIAVNQVTLYGR